MILQNSSIETMFDNASAQSASFNSENFPRAELFGTFGLQVIVSSQSSVNFAAIVQGSCDGTNWGDYGTAQTINANGSYMFNVEQFGFPYLRIKFTRTGGSAIFKVLGHAKQV
jgi:hypothetical protein